MPFKPELLTTLAKVLKTSEKNAMPRAMRMKLTPVCGRCRGSGHYSFNMLSGTTCFGCSGVGCKKPTTTAQMNDTIKNAEAAAANGKLDTYVEFQKALLLTKNADEKIGNAWSTSKVAVTMKPISHMIKDEESEKCAIVRTYNKPMSEAYSRVTRLSGSLPYIKDSEERQLKTIEFRKMYEDALVEIANLDAEFTAKYSDEWISECHSEAKTVMDAFRARQNEIAEQYRKESAERLARWNR